MIKKISALLLAFVLMVSTFLVCAETIKLAYSGGSLKLRNGPGTNYKVNAYLSNGDKITVLSKGSVWSKVKTAGGKVGYVKNLYISGNGSQYASGTTYYDKKLSATVKTKYSSSTVNLRAGAASSTASMGTVKNGTKLTVLGKNGSWYLVSTANGTEGYIHKNYVVTSSAASAVTAKVTGKVVYIRQSASKDSKAVTALTKGTEVKVLSTSNSKWWKVQYKSYTGYMYSKYLKKN